MRPPGAGPPVTAPTTVEALHGGYPHLVLDAIAGIVVGVVIVGLYLATLSWVDRRRDAPDGVDRSTDRNGSDS